MMTFVRRDAWSLPTGDPTLPAYAKAVAVMRERDDDDPTSWAYQAAIHGSHAPPQPLWNQCEHGSWYFLPWHRIFLYYFEQIVRAAVVETGGPADWALPYWNYGLSETAAAMPEPFRSPAGEENPLYVSERDRRKNEGWGLAVEVVSPAKALLRPLFTGSAEFGGGAAPPNKRFWHQTGRIEQTPHNDVHNEIGGWMLDPREAARDPIFWLHHANIDRIWAVWSAKEGSAPPSDGEWMGQSFEFFDAAGNQVSKTCAEVVDTVALDYTYDPPPESSRAIVEPGPIMPSPTPPEPKIVGASSKKVTLEGTPREISVGIDQRAKEDVLGATSMADPRRLFLNVEDIQGEVNPGSVYGIYVNLPGDPSPDALATHHVGNVSFFGIERARDPDDGEHGHGLRVSVEVGDLLRELSGESAWDDEQVKVTFRPLTPRPPKDAGVALAEEAEPATSDPPVQIGRVSLSVD